MTAQSQKSCCCHITGISSQGNGFYYIGSAADTASYHKGNLISDAFIPKSLVYSGQSQFHRNSNIVTDSGRCCSGTASETVNGNDICTASGNSAVYAGRLSDGVQRPVKASGRMY